MIPNGSFCKEMYILYRSTRLLDKSNFGGVCYTVGPPGLGRNRLQVNPRLVPIPCILLHPP